MSSAVQTIEGGNVVYVKNETINFASTATGALSAAVDVDLAGVKKGDHVLEIKKVASAPEFGKRYVGYVDDTNSLKVYFENSTGGTVDPASADYEITVISRRPL